MRTTELVTQEAVLPDGHPNAGRAALRAVLDFALRSRWSQTKSRAELRENHAKRYTCHEVTAPRGVGSPDSVGTSVLLFDGVCGLCKYTVRFMLQHDSHGRLFFAAQQQPIAATIFARHALDPQQINSAVLVSHYDSPREQLTFKSDAILGCLTVLGGPWAFLAAIGRLVPRALRNIAYNWLARNRHRLFGDGESCTLPTPAERARFLGD
jgi:predicted DCC family thiol-disulfide oxidoreductase YuxK